MGAYSNELSAWVRNNRVSRRDKNMVVFLTVKKDLIDALESGYTVRTIWLHMVATKRLEVSYDTFLSYVKSHIRTDRVTQASRRRKVKTPSASQVSGFQFNPVGKKEELI